MQTPCSTFSARAIAAGAESDSDSESTPHVPPRLPAFAPLPISATGVGLGHQLPRSPSLSSIHAANADEGDGDIDDVAEFGQAAAVGAPPLGSPHVRSTTSLHEMLEVSNNSLPAPSVVNDDEGAAEDAAAAAVSESCRGRSGDRSSSRGGSRGGSGSRLEARPPSFARRRGCGSAKGSGSGSGSGGDDQTALERVGSTTSRGTATSDDPAAASGMGLSGSGGPAALGSRGNSSSSSSSWTPRGEGAFTPRSPPPPLDEDPAAICALAPRALQQREAPEERGAVEESPLAPMQRRRENPATFSVEMLPRFDGPTVPPCAMLPEACDEYDDGHMQRLVILQQQQQLMSTSTTSTVSTSGNWHTAHARRGRRFRGGGDPLPGCVATAPRAAVSHSGSLTPHSASISSRRLFGALSFSRQQQDLEELRQMGRSRSQSSHHVAAPHRPQSHHGLFPSQAAAAVTLGEDPGDDSCTFDELMLRLEDPAILDLLPDDDGVPPGSENDDYGDDGDFSGSYVASLASISAVVSPPPAAVLTAAPLAARIPPPLLPPAMSAALPPAVTAAAVAAPASTPDAQSGGSVVTALTPTSALPTPEVTARRQLSDAAAMSSSGTSIPPSALRSVDYFSISDSPAASAHAAEATPPPEIVPRLE